VFLGLQALQFAIDVAQQSGEFGRPRGNPRFAVRLYNGRKSELLNITRAFTQFIFDTSLSIGWLSLTDDCDRFNI
jgi:hypothetical protein